LCAKTAQCRDGKSGFDGWLWERMLVINLSCQAQIICRRLGVKFPASGCFPTCALAVQGLRLSAGSYCKPHRDYRYKREITGMFLECPVLPHHADRKFPGDSALEGSNITQSHPRTLVREFQVVFFAAIDIIHPPSLDPPTLYRLSCRH
jgi:hypothetical protein